MTTLRPLRKMGLALAALLLVFGAGCLQIETRVKLNEDGSAVVTERVRFTRELMDLAGDRKPELLKMLSREAAAKRLGKDAVLVKHEIRDAEGAAKESFAEFKLDDLNKFQYASPWFALGGYAASPVMKCELAPVMGPDDLAGHMRVRFSEVRGPGQPAPKDGGEPPGLTPAALQVYRDAGPILGDMLKGFRLRFTFECYAPLVSGYVRGERTGATVFDLLDVSSANMDKAGMPFFENEEVMAELAQLDFGGPHLVRNVEGYWGNETLPAFYPVGSKHKWGDWGNLGGGGGCVSFTPSRHFFDKHFAGKKIDYYHGPKGVPATWENLGWKGKSEKPAATEPVPENAK